MKGFETFISVFTLRCEQLFFNIYKNIIYNYWNNIPLQNTVFNIKSFNNNQSNVTYELIWEMIYLDAYMKGQIYI